MWPHDEKSIRQTQRGHSSGIPGQDTSRLSVSREMRKESMSGGHRGDVTTNAVWYRAWSWGKTKTSRENWGNSHQIWGLLRRNRPGSVSWFGQTYHGTGASTSGSAVKNLPANARDIRVMGLIPGWGRSPGGGHGNPLQYSCLENPMDRRAWQDTIHRVTKSWTRLSDSNSKVLEPGF